MDTHTEATFCGHRLTKEQLVGLLGEDQVYDEDGYVCPTIPRERLDKRLIAVSGDYSGCTIIDAVVLDDEFPDVVLFGIDEENGEFPYFLGILSEVRSSRWAPNDVGAWRATAWPKPEQLIAMLRKHGIEPEGNYPPTTASGYPRGLHP